MYLLCFCCASLKFLQRFMDVFKNRFVSYSHLCADLTQKCALARSIVTEMQQLFSKFCSVKVAKSFPCALNSISQLPSFIRTLSNLTNFSPVVVLTIESFSTFDFMNWIPFAFPAFKWNYMMLRDSSGSRLLTRWLRCILIRIEPVWAFLNRSLT